jgi:hypothetical protein
VLAASHLAAGTMPPKPETAPDATLAAAFDAWVQSGMPETTCSAAVDAGMPVMNPYDTPVQCTSGRTWSGGEGSRSMRPGEACIACHDQSDEAPRFSIAGTVYPTAHEPNDCYGGASSSGTPTVVVTGADGVVLNLQVNSAGNFYYQGSVSFPFNARVVAGNAERDMSAAQTSGDCNSCHTESGANSAPGRIVAP